MSSYRILQLQDLVSATEALEEIKNSRKFVKLLELLLLMGNYLNAGSRNAQSLGFDLSFLTKVSFTLSLVYAAEK